MGKVVLRVLQVTFGAVGGLLIVPVAVNIGTGGTPPHWLLPFVGWLWPAAIGCVVMVILLELWDKLLGERTAISTRRPNDPRNYHLALAQAARYVELRLQGSLAERVRVALALDERPSAVRQPAHLVQRVSGTEFQLSAGLGIVDVFDQLDESMLILGAPGAGKTTQLLDLASALVARAQLAPPGTEPRIPVVVDLADWSRSRRRRLTLFPAADAGPRDFVEWLLASLRERYRIPEPVGRSWLADDRLTLLLDGLDEVRAADRERCVQEINALQSRWGVTRLAVCSRTADYDELAARLRLQGAVTIRPLTEEQVVAYFTQVSPRLSGVVEALRADPELWELLTSPLMLNIMALAYGDRAAQALTAEGGQAQRRNRLFDAYVVEVLARRRSHEHGSPERTLQALRSLAGASTRLDAGIRVVRLSFDTADRAIDDPVARVGRSWVLPASGAASSGAVAAVLGAAAGAVAGLVAGLLLWSLCLSLFIGDAPVRSPAPRRLPLVLWTLGTALTVAALALALRWLSLLLVGQPRLVVAGAAVAVALAGATSRFLFSAADDDDRLLRRMIMVATVVGGLLVTVPLLFWELSPAMLAGWGAGAGGGIGWLTFVLSPLWGNLRGSAGEDARQLASTRKVPQAVLYTSAICVAAVAPAHGWTTSVWPSLAGWLAGICYGFGPGLLAAFFLAGPLLKLVIVIAGEPVPWRRSLLRFAVDRSLLTRADGEYRFIHLLVRDYLAECDPYRLAQGVERRRAELSSPVPSPAVC